MEHASGGCTARDSESSDKEKVLQDSRESRGIAVIVRSAKAVVELFNKEILEIGRLRSVGGELIGDAFGKSTTRGRSVGDFVWYETRCFP